MMMAMTTMCFNPVAGIAGFEHLLKSEFLYKNGSVTHNPFTESFEILEIFQNICQKIKEN